MELSSVVKSSMLNYRRQQQHPRGAGLGPSCSFSDPAVVRCLGRWHWRAPWAAATHTADAEDVPGSGLAPACRCGRLRSEPTHGRFLSLCLFLSLSL